MERRWQDEDILRELYWEQKMDKNEIAEDLGCSRSTIDNWFSRHDIETRSKSEIASLCKVGSEPWHDEELVREMYWKKDMSQKDIADELGTYENVISHWMSRLNIDVRNRSKAVHLGKGGGINGLSHYFDDMGYERVGEHTIGEKIRIHRLVEYAHADVSFQEFCDLHTHYKNLHTADNRPENLELLTPSEHGRQH